MPGWKTWMDYRTKEMKNLNGRQGVRSSGTLPQGCRIGRSPGKLLCRHRNGRPSESRFCRADWESVQNLQQQGNNMICSERACCVWKWDDCKIGKMVRNSLLVFISTQYYSNVDNLLDTFCNISFGSISITVYCSQSVSKQCSAFVVDRKKALVSYWLKVLYMVSYFDVRTEGGCSNQWIRQMQVLSGY